MVLQLELRQRTTGPRFTGSIVLYAVYCSHMFPRPRLAGFVGVEENSHLTPRKFPRGTHPRGGATSARPLRRPCTGVGHIACIFGNCFLGNSSTNIDLRWRPPHVAPPVEKSRSQPPEFSVKACLAVACSHLSLQITLIQPPWQLIVPFANHPSKNDSTVSFTGILGSSQVSREDYSRSSLTATSRGHSVASKR